MVAGAETMRFVLAARRYFSALETAEPRRRTLSVADET